MRLRWAKSYFIENIYSRRGAAGGFLNFQMLLWILGNGDGNCHILAIVAGECSYRLLNSGRLWEILKGYKKVAGKCPNTRNRPIGEEAEFPSGYWQKLGNFRSFSLKGCISVHIFHKSKELLNFCKCSAALFLILLFLTIPLLARLKLVQQSI